MTAPDNTFRTPVLICSLGFFFIFMAFNTTQALATSLSKSLASACFAALYGVFAVACMVAPRAVNYLGPKLSMMAGAIFYVLMVFTYIKPMWATSLPAHILVGLGAPLLWTGSAVYISRYAKLSATLQQKPMSETANYLNGAFFSLFHFNGCTGLVFASIIMSVWGSKANTYMFIVLGIIAAVGIFIISLSPLPPVSDDSTQNNTAQNSISDTESLNGIGSNANVDDVDSIHSDSSGLSDNTTKKEIQTPPNSEKVTQPSILSVLKLIIFDPKMTLMSVLIFYNGVSLSFMFGDLSSAIIGKSVGTKALGFILASYYLWNTLFTIMWTKITTTRTRPLILALFVIAHTVFFSLLYFLPQSINFTDNTDTSPDAEKQIRLADPIVLDYIKGLIYCFFFSIGDSILQQQPQSLLQTFYANDSQKSDQAMSGMKLVQSAGIALMFVVGVFTTDVNTKIRLVSVFLALAALGLFYIILNWVPMTPKVIPDDELTPGQIAKIKQQTARLHQFKHFGSSSTSKHEENFHTSLLDNANASEGV